MLSKVGILTCQRVSGNLAPIIWHAISLHRNLFDRQIGQGKAKRQTLYEKIRWSLQGLNISAIKEADKTAVPIRNFDFAKVANKSEPQTAFAKYKWRRQKPNTWESKENSIANYSKDAPTKLGKKMNQALEYLGWYELRIIISIKIFTRVTG